MSNVLECLAQKLIYIYSDAKKGELEPFGDESKLNYISNEKGYFSLHSKGVECLDKTIAYLKNELDSEDIIVSDTYISNLIRDSIIELLPSERSMIIKNAHLPNLGSI